MDVRRVSVPTDTRAPGGHTNAYVLGRDPAVLVDPAGRTDALDRVVDERTVEAIMVTHTHPDHVGGVAAYAAETDATVWARRGYADRFRASAGVDPDRTFSAGTTLSAGDGHLTVLDTAGHAPDHVAIQAGADGPVCCGDCAVRAGSVVVGAPEGDMRAYLSSLRRLRAIDPPQLLAGHGPVVDDPQSTLERLIDHRLERERRVREAVVDGARTLEGVLESAYEKDLAGVRDLARVTVRAHLEKLAVEDDLEVDGDRVRLR
ncbi:MBL fold metallo-hydrolase [Natribaculum luteum]|uniref:MBL fold metallo-hydrolase n=1 Tax=Natribaculum luteum TaxID=1586232 RepID=A0ABD5NXG8_9EURY|nr:MBL fold metallo-hydrolase [Natribaculum luteum]